MFAGLRRLSVVCGLVTVLAIPAYAQQSAAQVQRTFQFSIPAKPLLAALVDFTEVTGVQLLYPSTGELKVTSRAVSGTYSAQEALRKMLQGTGIAFRFANQNTVTLEKQEAEKGTRTLGPVRVEGADRVAVNGINGSRDVTATEGTGSFTTGAMTIGSKASRSIKDTPQSVSVITSERLQQQNINDFTQALQQAPGITLTQDNSSLENTFYSRGFLISSIQIDGGAPISLGFANGYGTGYFPQVDMSQYDHVEVLRGAAGLFNGYGNPSGTINLSRKKPLDHREVILDTEWGSWDHYRTVLDATAPLALDNRLRGRMVATWQSNKHFYDIAEDQKTLIYGILDYDLTATTLVTLGASHTDQDSVPWFYGLPRYQTGEDLGLPRERSIAFPWNRWDFDTTEIFGSIEQRIGEEWSVKLNVTQNEQESTRKVGYSNISVNPIDNRGPRLIGIYNDFASDQLSAELTASGAFNFLGQRQEVTMGVNHAIQDGSGQADYGTLLESNAATPYQPYPGGPRYCYTTSTSSPCPAGTIAPETPPIDVFSFNPFDPIYTEPRNPLPRTRYTENGQVQTVAYVNLNLTAFDRIHLQTGLRWSSYENRLASDSLCRVLTGECAGRQIGDVSSSTRSVYRGDNFAWPPALALSYDIADTLTAYASYTDIYQDQSNYLDGDLQPLDPITGENVELGLRWVARDGRFNAALSVYRIEKQGFGDREPTFTTRYRLNPDGTRYRDANGALIVIANDGTELANGQPDPYHYCCYIQLEDRSELSEGVDAEWTGELLAGWQIAASYTFSRNEKKGSTYGLEEGQPLLSIQPEHLYKLWTTYDFGGAGARGLLSNLTVSLGINGQSEGYRAGRTCPDGQVGQPNSFTGIARCLVSEVPFEFTVEPYTVVSGRIGYRLTDNLSAALNLENIFDETYYQSVGSVAGGNWYGAPRSFTLSVRGRF